MVDGCGFELWAYNVIFTCNAVTTRRQEETGRKWIRASVDDCRIAYKGAAEWVKDRYDAFGRGKHFSTTLSYTYHTCAENYIIYVYRLQSSGRAKNFRHPTTLVGRWRVSRRAKSGAQALCVSLCPNRVCPYRVACVRACTINTFYRPFRAQRPRSNRSKTARGLTQVSDDTLNLKHIWPLPMSAVYVHSARTHANNVISYVTLS